MKLGIVILQVRDLERARKFYTDVVGLKVDEKQSGPAFVALVTDGPLLALQDVAGLPANQVKEPGSVEIGFNMDGVDAIYRRWKSAGAQIVSEPETRPFGRYFEVKDPDGHHLDVYGKA